ncbi:hypothetical protein M758_1G199200 [Ceratodon purpureus]|nr:hypothetical protein M758_1G199200 [Ceratodon purpureus]
MVPTSSPKDNCDHTRQLDEVQDTEYGDKRVDPCDKRVFLTLAELDRSTVPDPTLERQMYTHPDRLTQIMQMRTTNRSRQGEQCPGHGKNLKERHNTRRCE